jgi:type I restriction enzyme, S subunit
MKHTTTTYKDTEIGLVPEEWDIVPVSDVGRVVTGKTPPTGKSEYWGSGYPFVTPSDIRDFNVRYDYGVERYVTEKWRKDAANYFVPKDTVCYVSIGSTIGKMCLLRSGAFTNQQINSIIVNHDNDPLFIYYQLRNGQHRIRETFGGGGAAKDIISKSTFQKVKVAKPEKGEQEQIAEILSSLDDKIELNRQINANLEDLACAMFRYWFVDFEFPDEDGKPYKSSGGKLVDSELGEIPEGWDIGQLTDVCEFNPTYQLQKGMIAKYAEMKDLPETGMNVRSFIERDFKSGSKFANHDTLLARITPCLENGKTGYVDFLGDSEIGWGSTEFIVLHPTRRELSEFLYILARLDSFREHAIQSMSGSSGRQRVQVNSLASYRIIVPDNLTMLRFHELVMPLFEQIKFNFNQSKRLTEARDSLLPRLMSGKMRVTI